MAFIFLKTFKDFKDQWGPWYKQIKNNNDQIELQRDLNLLESWGAKWGMRFNPAKCNIMRVSRKRSPFLHSYTGYTLSGQVLGEVEDTKYLGVTLSDNLDWSKHITTTKGQC